VIKTPSAPEKSGIDHCFFKNLKNYLFFKLKISPHKHPGRKLFIGNT